MATRKIREDSIQGQIKRQKTANKVMELPEGLELADREEEILWRQFTNARAHDDWRDIDLVIIHKIIMLEKRIRRHNVEIDKTDVVVENKRGTPIENPLLRVIDTLQRQQLAMIRSLSLGVSSEKAIAKNTGGAKSKDKEDQKEGKLLSLLAK